MRVAFAQCWLSQHCKLNSVFLEGGSRDTLPSARHQNSWTKGKPVIVRTIAPCFACLVLTAYITGGKWGHATYFEVDMPGSLFPLILLGKRIQSIFHLDWFSRMIGAGCRTPRRAFINQLTPLFRNPPLSGAGTLIHSADFQAEDVMMSNSASWMRTPGSGRFILPPGVATDCASTTWPS